MSKDKNKQPESKVSNLTLSLNDDLRNSVKGLLKRRGISLNAFIRQSLEAYVYENNKLLDNGDPNKLYFGKDDSKAQWESNYDRAAIIGHAIEACYNNRFNQPITSIFKIYNMSNDKLHSKYPNNWFYRMVESSSHDNGITFNDVLLQLAKYPNLIERIGGAPTNGQLIYWRKNLKDTPTDFKVPDDDLSKRLRIPDTDINSFVFDNMSFYEWLSFFKDEDSPLNDLYKDINRDPEIDKSDPFPFETLPQFCDHIAAVNGSLAARETAVGAYETYTLDAGIVPNGNEWIEWLD